MFNFMDHKGDANQNYNKKPPHASQKGYYQTDKGKTHLPGCGERAALCTAGSNVTWCSHCGKHMEVLLNIENRTAVSSSWVSIQGK